MASQTAEKIIRIEMDEEDAILAKVVDGDLSMLTKSQRLSYYKMICDRLGISPHSRPFEYLLHRGKITLYAKRDCTDQLRNLRGISISIIKEHYDAEYQLYTVWARAVDRDGRQEESCGVVCLTNAQGVLKGEARANAIMTAETKARRRATLSLCGLGWSDEAEIASIPGAKTLKEEDIEEKSTQHTQISSILGAKTSKIEEKSTQHTQDEQKITQQQATDLAELLALCDSSYRQNVLDLLKKRFGVVDLGELTVSLHTRVTIAAQKHLQIEATNE
jgi:hypothetical protein